MGAALHSPLRGKIRTPSERIGSTDMSDSNEQAATKLKELMGRVLESDASEAFTQFMVRRIALNDLAPTADHAVVDGIDESPDGGTAVAEAHLAVMPDRERENLLERG